MATSLTRNLKLRVNSNLTADAKYNLERIDTLGSTFLVDSTDALNIRSRGHIQIEPDSADLGGNSVGGTVSIGSSSHSLNAVAIYSDSFSISAPFGLLDKATGGSKYLFLQYVSDVGGSLDTAADRYLSIDLQGGNRSLILSGSLTTVGGDISFTTAAGSSVIIPASGTLSTLAGIETLTNKSIDAATNTLTNISNSSVAAGAGILYSKLNLADSLLNSDVSPSAAIARSKLGAGTPAHVIINDGAGAFSSEAQLAISRGGTGAATASAALNNLLPSQSGQANKILRTDGANASWEAGGSGGGVLEAEAIWITADGTSKVVTHNLSSLNVDISIIDLDDNSIIQVNSMTVTDSNTVTLNSSESPGSSWRIIIQANP